MFSITIAVDIENVHQVGQNFKQIEELSAIVTKWFNVDIKIGNDTHFHF